MPFEYNAVVNEVVDGDTLVIDIDLGFDIKLTNQKVRLLGVDTPESRTSDKIEKIFGNVSKDFVKGFVKECENTVIIKTHISDDTDGSGREKFGRLLGEIINPKTRKVLNEELVNKNYAVKYLGENKLNVADEHKKNRKLLIDRKEVKLTYEQAGVK